MSATNVGFGLGIGLVVMMGGSLLQELVGCAELAAARGDGEPDKANLTADRISQHHC
jgi:hypothetical protein